MTIYDANSGRGGDPCPRRLRRTPLLLPRHSPASRSLRFPSLLRLPARRSSMPSGAGIAMPHHIVIVGGGAGGLILATKLGDRLGRRGKARVTLVDCVLTHVWKPLLHEVAAGTLQAAADGLDYLVHARRHHFTFELGRMTGLDRRAREILLEPVHDASGAEIVPAQRLGYDTLVLAVGSMLNDFGVPGVTEHCLYLDSLAQAERIQQRVLGRFLRGHSEARTAAWPPAAGRDRRLRRHRRRVRRRASPCRPSAGRLSDARLRLRREPRGAVDRGRAERAAGTARAAAGGDRPPARSAQRRDPHRPASPRGDRRGHPHPQRRLLPGRPDRLDRRRQRPVVARPARRTGGQPHGPAGGRPDAEGDPRREHLRARRLRRLPAADPRPPPTAWSRSTRCPT